MRATEADMQVETLANDAVKPTRRGKASRRHLLEIDQLCQLRGQCTQLVAVGEEELKQQQPPQ